MSSPEELFREALSLPIEIRTELTERLIASLAEDISPEISEAQLKEVRRRIQELDSGQTKVVPGEDVLARVRKLLTSQ
jgi:putative addiction module component (TIGR02574 family)